MQIHLSPRHLRLTAALHTYVAGKIEHLEDQTDEIVAAHVVLLHDETKTKKYTVKVHLAVPGPDVHAEDAEQDLYVAIDKVVDKLHQLLRKRKTKRNLNKRHRLQVRTERQKLGR
ncbi:MAG: ribosome-associated translation inhibitor RaiA [Chthoniobacterales bacterium]